MEEKKGGERDLKDNNGRNKANCEKLEVARVSEMRCLKAQVSGAAEELSRRSLTEENTVKLVENLKSAVEDSCKKASLNEEIYKSAIREQITLTRLESLITENRQLRDHLTDADNEAKCLKAQVSGVAEELSRPSLAEENMVKLVENLKSTAEDSYIKATLNEEIYKFAIREQMARIRCDSEDSNMEFLITREIYDIILREVAVPAETAKRSYGIEDSDIESSIILELNGLIFTETIRDAGRKLNNLYWKVVDEEIRIFLETEALEVENELKLEVEEKEKLKQEMLDLRTAMKQKEKLAMDLSISLSKERSRLLRTRRI